MKRILFLLILGVSVMMGQIKTVDEKQLQEMIKNGTVVIDIRRQDEFIRS